MSDDIDRASEREAQLLEDALSAQARRAGLHGKTVHDSARHCRDTDCGEPIPQARREALPGCRYCVRCQARRDGSPAGRRP